MKFVVKIICLLAMGAQLFSCSSYVESMHRSFDRAAKAKRARALKYQQAATGDRRPINNPVTLGSQQNYAP